MGDLFFTVNDTLNLNHIHPKDSNWLVIWLPLLSTLAGGILVLLGQWISRKVIFRKELRTNLVQIISSYAANILILKLHMVLSIDFLCKS